MESPQHTQTQPGTTTPPSQAPPPGQLVQQQTPTLNPDQLPGQPEGEIPAQAQAGYPTHGIHAAQYPSTMAYPQHQQQQHGMQYLPHQYAGTYYPQASQPMPPMMHPNQQYAYLPGQYPQYSYPQPQMQPQHSGIATPPQQLYPAQPYYYDPNAPPPPSSLASSAATSPRMYPATYAASPGPGMVPMTPQQGSSGGTAGPATPSRRSPRYATSNSINGVRMNSFVFPQQQQQQQQQHRQGQALPLAQQQHQQTFEGSAGGSGLGSLPPKPTFQGAGGMGAVASTAAPAAGLSGAATRSMTAEGTRTTLATSGQGRTEIQEQLWQQLPPLPSLPSLPQPPDCFTRHAETPRLANGASATQDVQQPSEANGAPVTDGTVDEAHTEEEASNGTGVETSAESESGQLRSYIKLLLQTVEGYRLREEAMQLRVQALLFQPHESWSVVSKELAAMSVTDGDAPLTTSEAENETGEPKSAGDGATPPDFASVLGVRLLRKVAELQKENDELGELLSAKLNLDGDAAEAPQRKAETDGEQDAAQGSEVEMLKADLQDSHHLLGELSSALKAAESRASRAEMALEVAVKTRSVGIMN